MVQEGVGKVLAHAHRVQGVGHLVHAKLTGGLLGVPLGACGLQGACARGSGGRFMWAEGRRAQPT